MSSDIAIVPVGLPCMASISKKPSYLITLEEVVIVGKSKNKISRKFITFDKPEILQGFVQVKGIFSDLEEGEIIKNFSDLLTSVSKDLILEVMIPWHKISYIRSLVFKQK